MLRLNVADPADEAKPENPIGLVAGDAAGFPNGRRLGDNVVTIELRAVAGLTIPLVDPSFTPDGAAALLTDGTKDTNAGTSRSSPTSVCPAAATRPSPGRRRPREHSAPLWAPARAREPARRPGPGAARHRGDVGALVVTMPAAMVGEEVEVLTGREEPGHHRPHVAVVPRPVDGWHGAVAGLPGAGRGQLRPGAEGNRRRPAPRRCLRGSGHHGHLAGLTGDEP